MPTPRPRRKIIAEKLYIFERPDEQGYTKGLRSDLIVYIESWNRFKIKVAMAQGWVSHGVCYERRKVR